MKESEPTHEFNLYYAAVSSYEKEVIDAFKEIPFKN